ncbi:transcription elongation factor B, polypeptide 1 [Strigomonas culicis]|uniref:Transcription elongation factor B, polypeptide 1 n=1 Tax=Strigomonas culicis TaxID=28005 RepID=S9U640_9TRYP|nr:transcription elongation factor B, polypeptide 1 [Strigomonas culicis]|eukprot:EPY24214.1 transcription elongation factor B, polypeptide 1 [Strigomonas culicis]
MCLHDDPNDPYERCLMLPLLSDHLSVCLHVEHYSFSLLVLHYALFFHVLCILRAFPSALPPSLLFHLVQTCDPLRKTAYKMTSTVPFNPMRKTPPPPPHIDTVGVNPLDYISVCSKEGHECIVHRNCLRESPLIRRTFEKGVDVSNDFIDILFSFPFPDDSAADESGLPLPIKVASPVQIQKEGKGIPAMTGGMEGNHDHRVRIVFHTLSASLLEIVLAYLYQKCLFEQTHLPPKDELEIPTSYACEILKVATALEC